VSGRRLTLLTIVAWLAATGTALAHDAPEGGTANWVMVDWLIGAFAIFTGASLVGFVWAYKAGHFHHLERHGSLPLLIVEEDYYTPDWAREEAADDGDADR